MKTETYTTDSGVEKLMSETIAKFMGSQYVNYPFKANKDDDFLTDFWHWSKPTNGYPKCGVTGIEWSTAWMIGNFKFNTSWDWLMPVIDKIRKHNYETMGNVADIQHIIRGLTMCDIAVTFKYVANYIASKTI
jgi:hypothetical protein